MKTLAPLPVVAAGWRWEIRAGLPLLRAVPLEGIGVTHAFTTRCGGTSVPPFDALNLSRGVGDQHACVTANRKRVAAALGRSLDDHVEASQVHGDLVAPVTGRHRGGLIEGADGLTTADPAVLLAVHCADCVPILLADPVRRAVAVVHSGWRGTALGAAAAAVRTMVDAFRSRPGDMQVVIGPAIGPCCYAVDAPVFDRFTAWSWRDRVFTPTGPGQWTLDLWEANRQQLLGAGVPPTSITAAALCTAHHPALFFSHRRDGTTGRMAAMIAMPASWS